MGTWQPHVLQKPCCSVLPAPLPSAYLQSTLQTESKGDMRQRLYDLKQRPSARLLGEGCAQAASGAERGSVRTRDHRSTGLSRPGRDLSLKEDRRRSQAERFPGCYYWARPWISVGPELSRPEGSDILPDQKGARWTERQILMSVKCFEVLGETGSD